jgi:Uma2 family endonuclease
MSTLIPAKARFVYPSSDGKPMAENTLQFKWIVTIQGNLDLMFRDRPDVFVAGDHLIYPLENNAVVRQAPDVYVAFGRPKGDRGSYAVAEEEGIFPQVIFEVWSPGNRHDEMEEKRRFYERYGAEEYYIVYPDFPAHIDGWLRVNGKFEKIAEINGFVSPRLKIRFESKRGEIAVFSADGKRFLSFVEIGEDSEQQRRRAAAAEQRAEQNRQTAEQERQRALAAEQRVEEERQRALAARQLADEERQRALAAQQLAGQERDVAEEERQRAAAAQQHAEEERQRADDAQRHAEEERRRAAAAQQREEQERQRAAKLAERLRALGLDPDEG